MVDGSLTKTGRHDIAEILLKVSLKHTKKQNQTNCQVFSKGAKFCIQV